MANDLKRSPSIAIFGGTFDPFHLGHLNLAIEMLEKKGLDEIWFCPARLNPHKLDEQPPTDIAHRLEMVRLGIRGIPQFKLLDIEAKREGPSYTYATITEIMEREKGKPFPAQLSLIIGEDSLKGFSKWHRAEELNRLVPLLIGSRNAPHLKEGVRGEFVPTRIMDISATDVRSRLKKGLICDHLVPKEVLDYIKTYHLYY